MHSCIHASTQTVGVLPGTMAVCLKRQCRLLLYRQYVGLVSKPIQSPAFTDSAIPRVDA